MTVFLDLSCFIECRVCSMIEKSVAKDENIMGFYMHIINFCYTLPLYSFVALVLYLSTYNNMVSMVSVWDVSKRQACLHS